MAAGLQVRETKNLAVMRDDEIIDVCSPWPNGAAASGAHFKETDGVISPMMMDNQGRQPQKKARFDFDFVMNVDDRGGLADEDNIAKNVDDFLDDFLAFSGSNAVGGGGAIDEDMVGIADEDLAWLHEPDAFLPLVSTASSDENSQEAPDCGGEEGGVPSVAGVSSSMVTPPPPPDIRTAAAAEASYASVAAVSIAPPPNRAVAESGGGESSPYPPSSGSGDEGGGNKNNGSGGVVSHHEQIRRQKVARYLAKKKRRKWFRSSPYQSRQRVANARPRHKGRFLPLESEFVPIAELQRRQRALMIQMEQNMAKQKEEAVVSRGAGEHDSGRGEEVEIREFSDSVAI